MIGSIGKILSDATVALQTAEITEPRKEAVSLLMHVLNVDRAFIIAHPERELGPDDLLRFREFVTRRATREPLQYITGVQEFFNLKFAVTPDVLIPRPETELIVEAALELFDRDAPIKLADIGTGSGCIAISLLKELRHARAVAVDISAAALALAARNAERLHVIERLRLIQSDGFRSMADEAFDLIVSNPPYVSDEEMNTLQREVRYEPAGALAGGRDGFDVIRRLLKDAPRFLRSGGHFILEIGFRQGEAVSGLIHQTVWELIEIRPDLAKIPRTVILRKRN